MGCQRGAHALQTLWRAFVFPSRSTHQIKETVDASIAIGGAGYVGSSLIRRYEDVVGIAVYDNLSRGHRRAVPDTVDFNEGDIATRTTYSRSSNLFARRDFSLRRLCAGGRIHAATGSVLR